MKIIGKAIRRHAEKRAHPTTVNFWCHVADGVVGMFGLEMTRFGMLFPLLAVTAGATTKTFGKAMSLVGLVSVVSLLIAPHVESIPRKKKLVLILGLWQRLPLLFIVVILYFFADRSPILCLWLVAGSYYLMSGAMQIVVPAWTDLVAETISTDRLRRLSGYRHGLAAVAGLGSGFTAKWILGEYAYPVSYELLYGIGFGFFTLSWLIFALVDEIPHDAEPKSHPAPRHYLRELGIAVRRDRSYRYYLAYWALANLSILTIPFFVIVATKHYGMTAEWVAFYGMSGGAAGGVVGSLVLARYMERFGYEVTLTVSRVFFVCAAIMAAIAPTGQWYAAVFVLVGMAKGMWTVNMPFMVHVFPRDTRVGYQSLSMVALAPVMIVTPLGLGYGVGLLGHTSTFIVVALLSIVSLWPLHQCARAAAQRHLADADAENNTTT